MKCVRCLSDNAYKAAEAPDGSGAWEFYCCRNCNYGWRSTEEEEIVNIEKRDPNFQLTPEKMDQVFVLNKIPSLRK
ncbi:MAG: non-oxidative hydroxyarylic acid decarboxylases subunit D [Anaerovoracaceae bacterium]|jgi:hypothetical protein